MAESFSLLDQSSDSEVEFTINKNYADRYNTWRNKEEMQKLKDLSKDISETSSESEEEEEPVIEKDFLKTLSLLKSKDPKIYNQNVEFFKEENVEKKPQSKKEKPMFMKDYERKVMLERNGKFSDDEDEDISIQEPNASEELDEIARSLKAAAESDNESIDGIQESKVGGLFQIRTKTKQEEEEEEEEHLQWLKGQKKKIDKDTEKDLSFLRNFWNDSNLDDGEKFLRDYLLNQKFLDKSNAVGIPSSDEIMEDGGTLLEDDEALEQQEMFEHKYNFRFEEPDPEFIKRYPRTVGDSLRRTDKKRKMRREEYAERKKKEKEQKREELKRLKALKRKEIEEKFFKLKEASGKEEINFDEDDIESDFDPDKHDAKMKELFDGDYYAVEEEQKPEFQHDDEIDDEDWDHWTRDQTRPKAVNVAAQNKNDSASSDEANQSDDEANQTTDRKAQFHQEMIESTRTGRKKGRRKSLFAKIVSEPKPLYDPEGKSFEEYLDEYYNLDYEDVIGDLPVRFKYRKVIPNDFGLTAEEVLAANDKELNRWCSVKKTCQYRRDDEELYDVQAFQRKAQNIAVKQKILSSIYAPPNEESEDGLNTKDLKDEVNDIKPKRKRSKKKSSKNGFSEHDLTQDDSVLLATEKTEGLESSNTMQNNVSKSKKRKRNMESEDETSFIPLENNAVIDTQKRSTLHVDDLLASKESKEGLEFSNDIEENLPKRKKRKKNADSADKTLQDSPFIESDAKNKNVLIKESEKRDSSHFTTIPSVSGTEQQNSSSNKSKRKNRKKKRNQPSDEKGKQFNNAGKPQNKPSDDDKRLALSNERLAAFGINPKKFKNSIIYSKK